MTLLDRILARGFEFPADPVLTACIERHVRRIQPDPMFRRRLRSVLVNQYVAAREGLMAPPPARLGARRTGQRQMGPLGRGVLYASLFTAVSVTAVGAASARSLPGDALFNVKLELEQIRMQIAPPSLRDDLAAMALDERLDEVEQLATLGRWELVDDAAELAAAAEAALVALVPDATAREALTGEAASAQHALRIAELMLTAPTSAMNGLQIALDASTAPRPSGGSDASGVRNEHGRNGGAGEPSSNGTPHDPRGQGSLGGGGSQGGDAQGSGSPGIGSDSPTTGAAQSTGNDQDNTSQPPDSTPSPAARPSASPSEQPLDQGQDGDVQGRPEKH